MKRCILPLLLLVATYGLAQQKTPNIILFLVDDMGWQDCSVPFHTTITEQNKIFRTPNMERMARQGMKFTQAYANQNCTPTRVSIMTGMNEVNHGVNSWTFNRDQNPEESPKLTLGIPQWNMNGLSPVDGVPNTIHATTLASLLKSAGYVTIHSGKAHWGAYGTLGANPLNLGFDINIGGSAAGQPSTYYGLDSFGNNLPKPNIRAVPGLQEFWGKDIFLTEALSQKTIRTLDSVASQGKPFFLNYGQFAVHTPIQGDKRFIQHYYDMGLDTTEARYASLIEGMDKALGDLMDFLESKGLEENTLLVFMSDNGGLTDVARGGRKNQHNLPLRSGKTSGYEGGLRVPMIVRWPGVAAAASTNDAIVAAHDLFPTFLKAAGVQHPVVLQKVDGIDMRPWVERGRGAPMRKLYWHYPHVSLGRGSDLFPFSVMREGPWKLIYNHLTLGFELYNTQLDLGEAHNLMGTAEGRKRGSRMVKELDKALRAGRANMPIDKKTGLALPYPAAIRMATSPRDGNLGGR